ncbi:hypothetical protein GPA19_21005 [Azoarcus indigens]|uniref:Uncharacterized protein n=2 Tax=Azoarcus indigens TaxID=29545 RepID=A0A4R6DL70_9RHOO|nr:hypothetical protein [Azoarcus indigens]TDN45520.1 hypothetical protein C7389_13030 [Azoarcus indigens]
MPAYAKTRKGLEEMEVRRGALGPRARRLLILADGKRDSAELQRMLPDPAFAETLAELEREGYIEAVAGALAQETAAPAVPAPSASARPAEVPQDPVVRHQMARNFMLNTLKTFSGPYAKLSLMERIDASRDGAELRLLLEDWMKAMNESSAARPQAAALRARLEAVI